MKKIELCQTLGFWTIFLLPDGPFLERLKGGPQNGDSEAVESSRLDILSSSLDLLGPIYLSATCTCITYTVQVPGRATIVLPYA